MKKPVPFRPDQRFLIVSASGWQLSKPGLDTAFQRLITQAIEKKVLAEERRFGMHDSSARALRIPSAPELASSRLAARRMNR